MAKKKTVEVEVTTTENDKKEIIQQEVSDKVTNGLAQVQEPGEEPKKRSWKELLADPEEQKNARFLAASIQSTLRNWFTLERFMKKIKDDRQTAISRLFALKEFGYCLIKQEKNAYLFKISFNEIDEIELINDDLDALEIKRKALVLRREKLHERYKQRQELLDQEDQKKVNVSSATPPESDKVEKEHKTEGN